MSDPIEPDAPQDIIPRIDQEPGQPEEGSLLKKIGKKGAIYIGIASVAILMMMAYFTLGGGGAPASSIPAAPTMNNVIGSHPETPTYQKQIDDTNNATAKEALRTHQSAFPSPDYAPPKRLSTNDQMAEQETAPPTVNASLPTPNQTTSVANGTGTSAATSQATMAASPQFSSSNRNNPYTKALADLFRTKGQNEQDQLSYVVASDIARPAGSGATTKETPAEVQAQSLAADGLSLPQPGTLLPARMINGLNSDDPGPAIAIITAGPLRGARVIGSFETARTGLVLKFQTMSIPVHGGANVMTVQVDADAITRTKDALATSVNDHMVGNLASLFISSLASNAGSLLAESGTTVATVGNGAILQSTPSLSGGQILGSAAGQALGQAGQEYQQVYGNRPPTIKLAPGTAFTLAFVGSNASNSKGLPNLRTTLPQSPSQRSGIEFANPGGFGAYGGVGSPLGTSMIVNSPSAGQ